jgi:hypothetical protein
MATSLCVWRSSVCPWITAGNCAEEYRRANRIDPGVEPWADTTADLEPVLTHLYRRR